MAGRRVIAPRSTSSLQMPSVDDDNTQRALDRLASAIGDVRARSRVVLEDVDLVVGTNKIPHGLGRRCVGYGITARSADATFAHAIDKTNPRPDLEVWITVVGAAQTDAIVEVF